MPPSRITAYQSMWQEQTARLASLPVYPLGHFIMEDSPICPILHMQPTS